MVISRRLFAPLTTAQRHSVLYYQESITRSETDWTKKAPKRKYSPDEDLQVVKYAAENGIKGGSGALSTSSVGGVVQERHRG